MHKVVYNNCFGGFSLSKEAVKLAKSYAEFGSPWHDVNKEYGFIYGIERHDKILVRVVEELGEAASGMCASLVVEEIPENVYRIDEYDGCEEVQVPDSIEWVFIKEE